LLKLKPDDRNLQIFLERLQDKLKEAHQREKDSEVTDPLHAMIELMVMTEEDVQKWLSVFRKIDKTGGGRITLDDVYEFFQMTPTPINKEVFFSMDALDDDGLIEFSDFLRAVGTYCFFGKDDILRYTYNTVCISVERLCVVFVLPCTVHLLVSWCVFCNTTTEPLCLR
jgi:hypothetical protein